ncbi:MAG: DinB family protein [Thermoanaerobaculia bacterium]
MRKEAREAPPGFPDLYREISTERLLAVYEAAPRRFALALEGLGASDLGARVVTGKWTVQEIVCHVADSETVAWVRFRQVLAEPGARFPGYDQDRFAAGVGYAGFDAALVRDTLELFGRLRSISSRLLRRIRPEAWGNAGIHREWGEMTLRQLLELYADHGERHLEQVLDRRAALGKPLMVEPLLPARLY